MIEVRCCCAPENLIGLLPEGLPYETRELNDRTFAYPIVMELILKIVGPCNASR